MIYQLAVGQAPATHDGGNSALEGGVDEAVDDRIHGAVGVAEQEGERERAQRRLRVRRPPDEVDVEADGVIR